MASGVSLGSRGAGYQLNILENRVRGGHFEEARFIIDIGAYSAYTKRIGFLFFSGFFKKPMASGVSLVSRRHGYKLNILANEQKGSDFVGA